MSITLESGMKLQGKAGAATALVVTVFGLEVATAAYKRLAQVTLGTGATSIYTAPAGGAIVSAITVQSIHAADQTCELWADSAGTADANRVFKSTGIPAGGGAEYDGAAWRIRDAAGRPITATQTLSVPAQEAGSVITASPTALNFAHALDVTDVAGVPRIDVDESEFSSSSIALAALTGGANDDIAQKKAGVWTNRTLAQLRADLYAFTFDTHANRLAASPTAGQRWKETNTGLIYYYDGAAWQLEKAEGHIRKTADETVNNSATVQNDDHLFWPVEANEVWVVLGHLICSAPSTTSDFKFGFSVPAGATYLLNTTSALVGQAVGGSPAAFTTTTKSLGSINGTYPIYFHAVITVSSTAGTATLQWAQDTATVEDTKVLTNSILQIRRLA